MGQNHPIHLPYPEALLTSLKCPPSALSGLLRLLCTNLLSLPAQGWDLVASVQHAYLCQCDLPPSTSDMLDGTFTTLRNSCRGLHQGPMPALLVWIELFEMPSHLERRIWLFFFLSGKSPNKKTIYTCLSLLHQLWKISSTDPLIGCVPQGRIR